MQKPMVLPFVRPNYAVWWFGRALLTVLTLKGGKFGPLNNLLRSRFRSPESGPPPPASMLSVWAHLPWLPLGSPASLEAARSSPKTPTPAPSRLPSPAQPAIGLALLIARRGWRGPFSSTVPDLLRLGFLCLFGFCLVFCLLEISVISVICCWTVW